MQTDHARPAGITASMTVGELVRMVNPHASDEDVGVALAVETVGRDLDMDAEIMQGVRARRLPFALTGATGAAGWAAWGCANAAAPDARAAVVAGTVAATALALPVLRAAFRNRIPDAWRRRWWLTGALAAGWVDVAAAYGPDTWGMTGALVVGGAALSARWWAEWEVPNPNDVAPPEPEPYRPALDMSRAAQIERAWLAASGAGRGAIPRGSLLTGRTTLPAGGLQYAVHLDPDAGVGATSLSGRAAEIALVLRMSGNEVIVEVGESEDVAVLTIVPQGRAALAAGVPYEGPCYRDGRIPVALDVTWRERDWIVYERGQGVSSGLSVGDMRSGKTTTLELVGLGLRKSGVWRVWFGDGDPAGASSNLLSEVAHWPERTPDGLLRQLAAFEAVLESRAHQKNLLTEDPVTGLPVPRQPGQRAINEFPPCEDFPGYYWIIPELFQAVQNEQLQAADFSGRLDKLLRRAPKFGLGVGVDTQSALGSDFGSSTQLRSWLSRVNAFVMRTTNRSDQYAINGLTLSPGTLPRGGGWGLAAGQDGAGIMLRTMWQHDLHQWIPTLPTCVDDPNAALAIAPFLPELTDDPELSLEQYRAELEQWRANTQAGDTQTTEPAPAPAVSVGGVSVPAPLGGNVIPMPPRPATPAVPVKPRAVPPLSALGPIPANATRVLDILRSRPGMWRSAELAEETGLSASAVSKALGALGDRGMVRRQHGLAEAV